MTNTKKSSHCACGNPAPTRKDGGDPVCDRCADINPSDFHSPAANGRGGIGWMERNRRKSLGYAVHLFLAYGGNGSRMTARH